MPCGHTLAGPGILQWFVLQRPGLEAQLAAEGKQAVTVGTHQVRHRLAIKPVPVKPNAAVERETHALAAARELPKGGSYEQAILPSTLATPTEAAPPENRKHWRAVFALVAVADHPAPVASLTVIVTPVVAR